MAVKKSVGSLKEADLKGKRVFVRVDLNVPLDDAFNITDDTRIRAAVPTINYLMQNGARIILASHLGRPKGVTPKYSLKPLVPRLSELLGVEVKMANDSVGPEVEKLVTELPEGGVLLLENVRFYKEEEKNEPEFAKKLASLADLYVNDAFGTAHRAHASTEGVAKFLKPAVAGFLMQKELDYLVGAVSNPQKPFAAIVGGSKVSSKIGGAKPPISRVSNIERSIMSQNGKLMPNLDQNSTKLLNLTVLQRIDPFVEEILITAAHVTLYEFNIDNSQWSRKDVEGSLFVVKRSAQPRFQFIVMNRRNTDNLVEDLLGDFEFELQIPYLLYRNSSQEVNGIWFYNSRECEEAANLFNRILSAYSKVPTKFKLPSNKSEFEELEAVPSMSVIDGPLEPSSTTSNTADVPDDRSFVNFFSNVMRIGSGPNAAVQGQLYDPSAVVLPSPHPPAAVPPSSTPSPSLSTSSTLMPPLADAPEPDTKRSSNLVKPSSFFGPPSSSPLKPPVSSSVPTAPPLHPPGNLQRPYGAPLLQPFPPPNPPPSLTPTPNNGPVINRDKVREALVMLVQDDQFIDMVYRTILNAHHT